VQTGPGTRDGVAAESDLISFLLWCPCCSSSTPRPFSSPCWSSPRFLIIKTSMAPSVSSETQLTRVERTWRFSYRARDRVIGPFIVCIEVMSSSRRQDRRRPGSASATPERPSPCRRPRRRHGMRSPRIGWKTMLPTTRDEVHASLPQCISQISVVLKVVIFLRPKL
jgi:hypothetical protein